jgi:putative Mg2+ transporter-C (MgtC) family protein
MCSFPLPATAEKLIAGVVTGVGFLGAEPDLPRAGHDRTGQVLGLTTAASSWTAAAVGILAGTGLYVSALASCVMVLVIL